MSGRAPRAHGAVQVNGSDRVRPSRLPGPGALVALALVLGAILPIPAGAQSTPPDRAILLQQRKLQRNPYDAASYYRLGDAYIQKARETGDMSYFDLAERALEKSTELAPANAGAVRHLAFVFASRHEFDRAVVQARRALELDSADGDASGVLGDALVELGRYDEAETAYAQMIRAKRDLASYSRRSGLKTLRGDSAGSMADLRQAIAAGRASAQPRESVAWAQWQLGDEHFAVGDLAAAEASYHDALATYPGYYRALAGLARVRAAQTRYPDAIALYRQALAVIPLPEYAAALGDAYAKLGRSAEAKRQYELVEYIGRLSALNRVLYNRELVYFYADHRVKLAEAVELARREITVRKDIYAYDALAWALCADGRAEEAVAPMAEALRLGTRDARLFFHAGMVFFRLGNTEQAIRYLEQALATNPHFHVLLADEARATLEALRSSSPSAEHGVHRDG
jgi:tetratricopeptide (TPR) repeat protein